MKYEKLTKKELIDKILFLEKENEELIRQMCDWIEEIKSMTSELRQLNEN